MIYDTVIIGAGPAGSHLSYLLAKHGQKVALVDRSIFPRDKLCGGLLTYKTIELLNASYPESDFDGLDIKSVTVYYKNEKMVSFNILSSSRIVRRYSFDTNLISLAKEQNVSFYFGTSLKTINFRDNEVLLSNGTILKYKQLVGADGALSKVRKASGLPNNQLGFCVEAHISWDKLNDQSHLSTHRIEIYYGDYSQGYAWLFPSSDALVVGVGNIANGMKEKEIVDRFYLFLRDILCCDNVSLRGAYIPSGNSVILGSSQHKNVHLIGDAAGLIDPFTGEGIYYALLSAEMLAKAILSKKPTYAQYMYYMQPIVDTIDDNVLIRNEIYTPTILKNAIASMKNVPTYSEALIDETILRYSKLYRTAYEEFKYYSR